MRCKFCRVKKDAIPNPTFGHCKNGGNHVFVEVTVPAEMIMAYPQCMPNCPKCQWAMLCHPKPETPMSTIGASYMCTNEDCELQGVKYKIEPSIIMRKVKE